MNCIFFKLVSLGSHTLFNLCFPLLIVVLEVWIRNVLQLVGLILLDAFYCSKMMSSEAAFLLMEKEKVTRTPIRRIG